MWLQRGMLLVATPRGAQVAPAIAHPDIAKPLESHLVPALARAAAWPHMADLVATALLERVSEAEHMDRLLAALTQHCVADLEDKSLPGAIVQRLFDLEQAERGQSGQAAPAAARAAAFVTLVSSSCASMSLYPSPPFQHATSLVNGQSCVLSEHANHCEPDLITLTKAAHGLPQSVHVVR
jgi:hypothetical protein